MEISSIITGLVVAALIFVPFLLLAYSGNSDVKLLEKTFTETGVKEGLTFSLKEKINQTIIGLDAANNKVVFVKITNGISEIKTLNLSHMKSLSFVGPVSGVKTGLSQNNAYFSFITNNGSMEQKVYVYNDQEHKPMVLAEIVEKGKRWEDVLKKKLDVPIKPSSPNLKKSA